MPFLDNHAIPGARRHPGHADSVDASSSQSPASLRGSLQNRSLASQNRGNPPQTALPLGQWAKETVSIVERPDRTRLRLGTTPCG